MDDEFDLNRWREAIVPADGALVAVDRPEFAWPAPPMPAPSAMELNCQNDNG